MRHATSSLETARLKRSLLLAKACWEPANGYGLTTCPVFWRNVFTNYYLEHPTGIDDPRWDELLKLGYPLLRKVSGKRRAR